MKFMCFIAVDYFGLIQVGYGLERSEKIHTHPQLQTKPPQIPSKFIEFSYSFISVKLYSIL